MQFKSAVLALSVAAVSVGARAAAPDPAAKLGLSAEVAAAMGGIDAERIRTHVRFLSALARFGFALGWEALSAQHTVNWLPGDEFEAVRLRAAGAR